MAELGTDTWLDKLGLTVKKPDADIHPIKNDEVKE